ncbi:antibiotic biosynthesis monooxygenase [Leptospira idonii]|uniref:Antibiotic biosynthesis monooxygenase n=1 Tax=Leptospira idonii TaxID=1193500 RepID=A0A4R9LWU8_9LEPT|nr:antibiotic biosynthesis monooxygenase [Leptospira idonii]TGN18773.1 antibiotic biosynthesis monooxygenase [Leptospira idonii]
MTKQYEEKKTSGASAVITHQILEGKENEYEAWLNRIAPICKQSKGHLDWQIIRPISHLTTTYTVVIRFDSVENLSGWMTSLERSKLIEEVSSLLTTVDRYSIQKGLDFLFAAPSEETPKVPVRWKQFLVTWSAIFPLVNLVPLGLLPILRFSKIPQNQLLDSLLITGTIVSLMVYLIMPIYTKRIKNWLYRF